MVKTFEFICFIATLIVGGALLLTQEIIPNSVFGVLWGASMGLCVFKMYFLGDVKIESVKNTRKNKCEKDDDKVKKH